LTGTFNFAADLALVGATLSDVKVVKITNNLGWVLDVLADAFNLQDIPYTFRAVNQRPLVFGRIMDFRKLSRMIALPIVTDVSSNLCPIFRPSDLTNCVSWNRFDLSANLEVATILESGVTLTKGNTSFTAITPSLYKIGMLVGTDPFVPYYYQIIDIIGSTIYLNQRIKDATGSYDIYAAYLSTFPSLFNGNDFVPVGTSPSLFVWNGLNGYPIATKPVDSIFALTAPYSSDPTNLTFISLLKGVEVTGQDKVFAHSDNTPTPIELFVNTSSTYKGNADDGDSTNNAQITLGTSVPYTIASFSFADNGSTFSVIGSLNGNANVTDTQSKSGAFTSAVECFGGYYDGVSFNNGFSGEFTEVIILNDNTQANIDKCVGYLAHKYSLTSLLPISHPYKTIKP